MGRGGAGARDGEGAGRSRWAQETWPRDCPGTTGADLAPRCRRGSSIRLGPRAGGSPAKVVGPEWTAGVRRRIVVSAPGPSAAWRRDDVVRSGRPSIRFGRGRSLMRSDERQIRPAPGMACGGRSGTRRAHPPAAAAVAGVLAPIPAGAASSPARRTPSRWTQAAEAAGIAALLILVACPPRTHAQVDRLPDGTISEIRFEGNASIPSQKIKQKLLSRVGQPLDQQKVNADLKSLMGTKWFSDVQIYYEEAPPKSGKLILTFAVREMPVLTHVEFRGRKAIRLKEIEDTTDLKVGHRADPARTRLAMEQIRHLYQDKG